jgi:hypothetical protein
MSGVQVLQGALNHLPKDICPKVSLLWKQQTRSKLSGRIIIWVVHTKVLEEQDKG